MADRHYKSRTSKQKGERADRVLNWAIGIVAVLILVVGGFIFMSITQLGSGDKQADTPENQQESTSNNDGDGTGATTSDDEEASNSDDNISQDETSDTTKDDSEASDSKNSESDDETHSTEQDTPSDGYIASDGEPHMDGPWNSIGTKQEGSHELSFDEGSTDWNERLKVLTYVTGITPSERTLWYMGNMNGTIYGVVSKNGNRQNLYVVTMEWVDQQGWKPTSVKTMTHDKAVQEGYVKE
ncbi:YrrS family protein [Tuberibacillus sp. Marseille-P3662]|uniref:YrrS family protein n=1 Tax=Tuberibacillus sp. Marseille-P3662 TaxID=1965358 RepID=UPI000A1CCB53|nr:YrrS family protein [Tuberibacillus sp. Marseille-P3662]